MASFAALERFAKTLPGAERFTLSGQPALRVGGKMFAIWWPPDKSLVLRLPRDHLTMLFEVRPDTFSPHKVGTGYWADVKLHKLPPAEMKHLLTLAWATAAPKTLQRQRKLAATCGPTKSCGSEG